MTSKPKASIWVMTVEGGAAPPVASFTVWPKRVRADAGAWISIDSTTGAPHMWGDAVVSDGGKDQCGLYPAQADMGAARQRHRPRVGPTVAVEHRQGPEVDALRRQGEGQCVGAGVQVGAAMVCDHALWIACRAGSVVQRDRLPFVVRQLDGVAGIAAVQKSFVFDDPDPVATGVGDIHHAAGVGDINHAAGVGDIHHKNRDVGDRGGDDGRELCIRQQDPGLGMAQDEGDGAGRRDGC